MKFLERTCHNLVKQHSHVCTFEKECEGCANVASFKSKCSNNVLKKDGDDDEPSLSFKSNFSTDTLDIDLDFTFDDKPMPLDPTEEAIEEEEEEKINDDCRVLPVIPLRPTLKPTISEEREEESKTTVSCANTTISSYESCAVSIPSLASSQQPHHSRVSSFASSRSSSGVKTFSIQSWKEGLKGWMLVQEQDIVTSRSESTVPLSTNSNNNSKKSKSTPKNSKWAKRFCAFIDGLFYVFRSEADAQKYSSHLELCSRKPECSIDISTKKKAPSFFPLHSVPIQNSEIRVIRTPADLEVANDARYSMLNWLKNRKGENHNSYDDNIANVGSKKGKCAPFKIQIVERNLNKAIMKNQNVLPRNMMSTKSAGSNSTFGAFSDFSILEDDRNSTGSHERRDSINSSSSDKNKNVSLFIAFYEYLDREAWVKKFANEANAAQLDAGSLWIRRRRNTLSKKKKDDEWVKRYAVVTATQLELYVFGTGVLCETVSLVGVKVEPAYSAHIFVSHRVTNKQLVTLRAFDGTERNWWITALRFINNRINANEKNKFEGQIINANDQSTVATTA